MTNLRRRISQQTESLFAENHEAFFNAIGHFPPHAPAAKTASLFAAGRP
jgi:hypothetical protein